jgi:hypothetical protein
MNFRNWFEISSNYGPDDFKEKPFNFPRFRGIKNVVKPATENSGIELKLSYAVYNVFQRYWEGQSDPLYTLLSRRGNSVDFVRVFASPEEVKRLKKVAGHILSNSTDEGEKRTAIALLSELKNKL